MPKECIILQQKILPTNKRKQTFGVFGIKDGIFGICDWFIQHWDGLIGIWNDVLILTD